MTSGGMAEWGKGWSSLEVVTTMDKWQSLGFNTDNWTLGPSELSLFNYVYVVVAVSLPFLFPPLTIITTSLAQGLCAPGSGV